jgi:hypothetical protein
MKRSGIDHHSTMILPYGMKTVLGYKYKKMYVFQLFDAEARRSLQAGSGPDSAVRANGDRTS